MEFAQTPPAPRQCGDCALCCHLGEIPQVKAYNTWCQHCSTHQRCDIYDTRPAPCRAFYCHYLLSDIGEEWYPRDCGMVVSAYGAPARLTISVDPARPDIWRQAPYLPQLHHWARQGAVTVMVGLEAYAVYPERIEALGALDDAHTLVITELETTQGLRYRITRVPLAPAG